MRQATIDSNLRESQALTPGDQESQSAKVSGADRLKNKRGEGDTQMPHPVCRGPGLGVRYECGMEIRDEQ